jgi:hypothetical protein
MIDDFEKRVNAALNNIWDIYLFEFVLALISSFLVLAVAFVLFEIEFYYAMIPALLIGAIIYFKRRGSYESLKEVEKGNPMLQEKLMAAYDNKEKDNFIVRELVRDVSYDLDYLNTEAFINMKKVNA